MYLKDKLLKISKFLFILLIVLIPLNIGKHFVIIDSYVWGILVDYLIPTLYVQDILVFIIILTWFLSGGIKKIIRNEELILSKKEIIYGVLFMFALFLSVLSSQRFIPSIYFFARILLYFLFSLYILFEIKVEEYFLKILDVLVITTIFLGVLGIAQFIHHGSVFNNYLAFGEQPYNASTYGIAKKYFFGDLVIPSYGIFRHPNIFGGYLSVVLVWIFSFLKKSKWYKTSFLIGFTALLFTFHYSAWIVFVLGIVLQLYFNKNPENIKNRKKHVAFGVFALCIILALLPVFRKLGNSSFFENPSYYRRANLIESSYDMAKDFPLFGVGLNNFTVLIDDYMKESRDIRFTQPVHNVFLLLLAESGIFAFIFFLLFLFHSTKSLLNSSYFHILFISFLQILILGSLDHYFLTIHQTQLLFWLVIGLALQ